ncbi:MAG: hypothetical protein P8N31_06420 [Planctomycetota bacterium]|nr:hypothetical protein [Planctomycetota bacterium]MDG2143169.1 hypothetical protein [Planctomycetota bacterium]
MKTGSTLLRTGLLGAAAFAFASTAGAQVLRCDTFSYADSSIVPNNSWANQSGTAGDFLIAGGQAVVTHGAPSEDVRLGFDITSGVVYFGVDFSVDDLGMPYSGSDNEYFFHFKDDGFGFTARLDVVPGQLGGDYTVGISSDDSTADAIWGADLTYGTTYRAIGSYDQDNNTAELWIDAALETDTSIVGDTDGNPGKVVQFVGMRQSDSDMNETVRMDNLVVGKTFTDVLGVTGTCGIQTPRYSVTPNTGILTAGGRFVTGEFWRPVVTNTTSGVTDFILISALSGIDAPLGFGSLLCQFAGSAQFTTASGTAFALPIPANPALVGLPICTQGASVGAVIEMTNALDCTIGG